MILIWSRGCIALKGGTRWGWGGGRGGGASSSGLEEKQTILPVWFNMYVLYVVFSSLYAQKDMHILKFYLLS